MTGLQHIQELQFTDRPAAEALLVTFLRSILELPVASVELRPLAVSLNSFNGFLTLNDGKRYFFKTHTEPDTIIAEYYNATQLAKAGYPVLKPVMSSTEVGKQILMYEVIADESVFDVAWRVENGATADLQDLTAAQHHADTALFDIYAQTLTTIESSEAAKAPIHQLFWHRITGGRLTRFYGSAGEVVTLSLPDGSTATMDEIFQAHWTINGQRYADSIGDLITRAERMLRPDQAGPSVIGHGDAHNGNVFFRRESATLLYFDPAFAGRHHPLLDLVKPLYHNVFAMWMYFPEVVAKRTSVTLQRHEGEWMVEHNDRIVPIRQMFLDSKIQRVLIPTLRLLRERDELAVDWRNYLKAGLFCCPFLTLNLADQNRFHPTISLLGLAHCIEMGGESDGVRSLIDRTLDAVENAL